MSTFDLIEQVRAEIAGKHLHTAEDNILIACSGGMDSVALCHIYAALGYSIGIAHCNFHLRGEESDADASFVEALAEQLEASFFVADFDTGFIAEKTDRGIEETARDLRYTWLEEIRSNFNYRCIAVAHHAQDNIETALFHFSRGTGLKGMAGIPGKQGKIVRPLLFTQRKHIAFFCSGRNISYRTDSTNTDTSFKRNFIRHIIIPEFEQLNPSFAETATQNMHHLRASWELLEKYLEGWKKKWCIWKNGVLYIENRRIQNTPQAPTILHYILQPFGFNATHITDILHSIGKNGKEIHSATHRILIDRNYILCTTPSQSFPTVYITKNIKTYHTAHATFTVTYSKYAPGMHFNTSGHVAYFDADKLHEQLCIRQWSKGDYLYPLGLKKKNSEKTGKKKVSDILTDAKADPLQRQSAQVILCGEKIIWLCGYRQDARFSITKSTSRLCTIKMLPV